MNLQRRTFNTRVGLGGIAAAAISGFSFPKPAIARGALRWTMVTSWPRNLPGPGTTAQTLAERITALSRGRLEIRVSAAGELVPATGVFDAVSEGTIELYHSVSAYWGSKSRAIPLFCSQPMGLLALEQAGWIRHGGGQKLYDEMYARFGLKPFLAGNSGPQWFGWFRKEIGSPDDLRGMRFRTAGLNGEVLTRLGASVQFMGGPDLFQALRSGVIDAGEYVAPWTDIALGLHQVAPYYYWPGVGEPSSAGECAVNLQKYNALPQDLREAIALACQSVCDESLNDYNEHNPRALAHLAATTSVELRKVPDPVLLAYGNAAGEIMSEMREDGDLLVARIVQSFLAYREQMVSYMRYADSGVMNARLLDYRYPTANN
jgi:TRAP-type mannitol/chloroaromatic compound transport system substrate-binding protein